MSGTMSGSNRENTVGINWVNSPVNRRNNYSQVNPGDTLVLRGILSSALNIARGGSKDAPIVIQFDNVTISENFIAEENNWDGIHALDSHWHHNDGIHIWVRPES